MSKISFSFVLKINERKQDFWTLQNVLNSVGMTKSHVEISRPKSPVSKLVKGTFTDTIPLELSSNDVSATICDEKVTGNIFLSFERFEGM